MVEKKFNVGIDIGGTCTDCVVIDDAGEITVGKALSTPPNFTQGVIDSLQDAALHRDLPSVDHLLARTRLLIHACTVAENIILTSSGPSIGLLTTRGFSDTLAMMRGSFVEALSPSESRHLSALEKPEPLVAHRQIAEINERIDHLGEVLVDLDKEDARQKIQALRDAGVQSIAIALLWSCINPLHDQIVRAIVEAESDSIFVTCSSEIAPFVGEYERTVSAVLNAYCGPTIDSYLRNLRDRLAVHGLTSEPLVMQSSGGTKPITEATRSALGLIESGPAAGVLACGALGEALGTTDVLITDMGGTTFKVGLITESRPQRDYTPAIRGHRYYASKIWIESIGAGGGSIAWIDDTHGLLKVGPQGAGADPGPVCYGRGGTRPTVADASLALGYLNPDNFLGGRLALNMKAAIEAITEKLARPLGMDADEAAAGVFQITNSHMADLVRRATIERGLDPRDFVLFSIGGASGIHAVEYARELGIRQVVIPQTAAVQGPLGLVSADILYEVGMAVRYRSPIRIGKLNTDIDSARDQALQHLSDLDFEPEQTRVEASLDMRYPFQAHNISVEIASGSRSIVGEASLRANFTSLYEREYGPGSTYADADIEVTAVRVRAFGLINRPSISPVEPGPKNDATDQPVSHRRAYVMAHQCFQELPVFDIEKSRGRQLRDIVEGPAILESAVNTIVLNDGDSATQDPYGNIVVQVHGLQTANSEVRR